MNREPTIWKATLGPKAIEIIGNEDDGITIEGREVSGHAPAMAELVNRLLETKSAVGKRAAASIRKQVLEVVTLVGTFNPELGFLMMADKRLICGEPPSPINTLALAKSLKDYEPTGIDMVTGEHRWRSFSNKQEWINKASTWMYPGDACFDADGVQLRIGKDFDGARYPVVIARPKQ